MGARTKLNTVAMYGSLAVAAMIGGASQSWSVFFVVTGIMIAGCLYAGDIRIKGDPRPTNRRG